MASGFQAEQPATVEGGMTEQELMRIDDSFVFNEITESFVSPKGAFIETETHTTGVIYGIAVYIKERDNPDFEEAKW